MKKILILAAVAALSAGLVFVACKKETINVKEISVNQNNKQHKTGDRILEIDRNFVDTDGVVWHVSGYITYTIVPPAITSWDLTITNSNGDSYHFVGSIGTSSDENTSHLYDEDENEVPLDTIPGLISLINEIELEIFTN